MVLTKTKGSPFLFRGPFKFYPTRVFFLLGDFGAFLGPNFRGPRLIKSIGYGGSAWESNPPGTVLAPHTGFEVREPHQ